MKKSLKRSEEYVRELEDLVILLEVVMYKIQQDRTRPDYTYEERELFHRVQYEQVLEVKDRIIKVTSGIKDL